MKPIKYLKVSIDRLLVRATHWLLWIMLGLVYLTMRFAELIQSHFNDPNAFLCSFWPAFCFLLMAFIGTYRINLSEIPPETTQRMRNKLRIRKAPGAILLALVDFLFSPKTVELTFNQLVADWRTEYYDAWKQHRTKKARWINIRYRFTFACTFIMAMGLSKVFSLFKQISK